MQESVSIILSQNTIQAIAGSSDDRLTMLCAGLQNHKYTLASMLTSYHWDERGIVYGLEIDEKSISIDKYGQGSFIVKYGINIHYGCSDKDIELDKHMIVTINTDLNAATTTLTGENVIEREPDDF
ncbi:MAG: hypothetical protein EOP54_19830 [Sphingobacteriales bacterium]|nr:MAG: hypothetical protein EOP54_19830 [Sphingobacteriales bacterium]